MLVSRSTVPSMTWYETNVRSGSKISPGFEARASSKRSPGANPNALTAALITSLIFAVFANENGFAPRVDCTVTFKESFCDML